MNSKILLSIATAFLAGAVGAQTTYYSDAVNGADTNSGLKPSTAFLSMTQASSVMKKGDTLVVLPGTYNISVEATFPVQFGNTAVDQSNITIIGIEGPSKTIVDGGGTYAGIGMIRFRENARGARITGFTFKNMADAFWSCAIRLGSSSGDQFRAWDVEVDNCVFDSTLSRAFVIFGSSATTTRQATGMRVHNNLFLSMNPNRRSVAIYGDGDNHFYNNTIIHPTDTTNRAAIYLQALLTHGTPCKAVIKNNVIIGGAVNSTNNSWGIEKGPADTTTYAGGSLAKVENNNCFGNNVNYQGFTPSSTNLSVDPKFVSTTDLHLQSTSPVINKGTDVVPFVRHDPDGYPGRRKTGQPDMGAYEYHDKDFTITAQPKINATAQFTFTGSPAGLATLYLAFNEFTVFVPGLGQVLIDPTLFAAVGTTSLPGTLSVPVPNDPTIEGIRVVFQGLYSGSGGTELLNVRHTYITK